jgi:hypothetical protein
MEEADLAYTIMVHDYSVEGIIFKHGQNVGVPYDDWQWRPDTYELHRCPRTTDKSQVEKVWRRKDEGSPPPAHMN